MKTPHIIMLTVFAAIIAAGGPVLGMQDISNANSPPGGMLRTMPHGEYQCALPGDAGGLAFVEQAQENFRIFTASRYENTQGAGTYILRGENLTFTRGPKKGEQFERVGDNQLRKINKSGDRGDLLCTRLGSR